MEGMLLAKVAWWAQGLAILFTLICLFLIILVLLQKGRGSGLSAAFGGAGGQSAFGAKTGDVFTWVTIVVVAVFLLLSMVLTKVYVPAEDPGDQARMMSAPGTMDSEEMATEGTESAEEVSDEAAGGASGAAAAEAGGEQKPSQGESSGTGEQ